MVLVSVIFEPLKPQIDHFCYSRCHEGCVKLKMSVQFIKLLEVQKMRSLKNVNRSHCP